MPLVSIAQGQKKSFAGTHALVEDTSNDKKLIFK